MDQVGGEVRVAAGQGDEGNMSGDDPEVLLVGRGPRRIDRPS